MTYLFMFWSFVWQGTHRICGTVDSCDVPCLVYNQGHLHRSWKKENRTGQLEPIKWCRCPVWTYPEPAHHLCCIQLASHRISTVTLGRCFEPTRLLYKCVCLRVPVWVRRVTRQRVTASLVKPQHTSGCARFPACLQQWTAGVAVVVDDDDFLVL